MQIVRTIPGKTYCLAFSVGDAADGCIGSMIVDAYAAQKTLKVTYESNGTGGFKKAVLKFLAIGNRTRIAFLSSNYHMMFDGTLCGPVIDDVLLLSIRNPGRRLCWVNSENELWCVYFKFHALSCTSVGKIASLRFFSKVRKHYRWIRRIYIYFFYIMEQ